MAKAVDQNASSRGRRIPGGEAEDGHSRLVIISVDYRLTELKGSKGREDLYVNVKNYPISCLLG